METEIRLEKGMLISPDDRWYVLVSIDYEIKDGKIMLGCICDYANNVYHWDIKRIHSCMSLKEINDMRQITVIKPVTEFEFVREVPYSVIVEVLSGEHDDRF